MVAGCIPISTSPLREPVHHGSAAFRRDSSNPPPLKWWATRKWWASRKWWATLLLVWVGTTGTAGRVLAGDTVSLDGEWRMWESAETWVPVTVPFSNEPLGQLRGYQKVFSVPPGFCDDVVLLRFEGVVGESQVYLNGRPLGGHGSFLPFWFDVTEVIHRDSENDLIVTLDDRRDNTTVPYEVLSWVNYSGIIRGVSLECGRTAVLLGAEMQYDLSEGYAQVSGEVTVRAAGRPGGSVHLSGAILDGEPGSWSTVTFLSTAGPVAIDPAGRVNVALHFSFDDPQLWSPDTPHLYSLLVSMTDGTGTQQQIVPVGFRDVRVEGIDVLLNGRPLFLKGINRHDVYDGTGFVGTPEQMLADMLQIKATGANYARLIHYPHHPYILEVADRIGLLVSEEIPAWANFWDPAVRVKLYASLEELIRRDMNHPSVFLWITGNARAHPMPYAGEAQQLAKSLDRNRLVTYNLDNDEFDPAMIAQDVAFFHEAGLDLYMKITSWFYYLEYLQDAWANFPKDLPLLISEFGREGNDREPVAYVGDVGFFWGEDQQADAITEMLNGWRPHLPPYNDREHVTGLILFNYQDFDWPEIQQHLPNHIPSVHHGMVYTDRVPKQVVETLTEFYGTLPTKYVGSPQPDDEDVERLFAGPRPLSPAVNNPYRDSGPSISPNGKTLYFASDGPDHVGLPKLFETQRVGVGWAPPQLAELPQETIAFAFRSAPHLSADGMTLHFARAFVDGIYLSQTRIWASQRVEGVWTTTQDLGDVVNFPDAARATTDPCLSADGQTLYFSSDRPGGLGRHDLWFSRRVDGEWSEPVNLGPGVNTEHAESGPTISTDGATLIFSSDRPGGVGSGDLWVSRWMDGAWSPPKNLGPEVNSPGAEREPQISPEGRTLYFTGIRAGGEGLSDLWVAHAVCTIADVDNDSAVTPNDFGHFQFCLTGVNEPAAPGCRAADLDADGDVDLHDFGLFQACFE